MRQARAPDAAREARALPNLLLRGPRQRTPGNYFAALQHNFGADVIARGVVRREVTFQENAAAPAAVDFAISPITIFLEGRSIITPENEMALLRIFAFENFIWFAPGDIDGVGGHTDANLSGIHHCFFLRGQGIVGAQTFQAAALDGRFGRASGQQEKKNEKRRSHKTVTLAVHGYSRRCPTRM